ncbi:MAG: tRNA uridine-5-carboxymethylaminomethyl(34) synthesis GTPase MnmE [Gammaproteobacteria bacterium]|nr:tRNA uridine-5-carboxymethylaminomethyl(34) synthesis GTPase MnmE [Gammaproteobacteria bacterium]NNJ49326.1 tRNA uridine-5-carboxymethylaminomethyl(34) synthesis GTPase MnmE [Gammaproteobacteria bacterium]
MNNDTIAAIATPTGLGGVGIIRVSGENAPLIAEKISGLCPAPRYAYYGTFSDKSENIVDSGLTLYFKKPFSFTGEDVVEFHAHGGPVVLDILLKEILQYDVRPARAGEFTERAFLNDKIDLAQAEAIADLITADSEQAARAAMRSMQGEFSALIHQLVEELISLRIYVESALDFPEEEIDFLADEAIAEQLDKVIEKLASVKQSATQGRLLKEGMTVVIAGKPNAGKSSLLNQLAGQESAIVTDVPGTTRDILREHIQIDGLPLHIVDTAGLRESEDVVEQEGVKRAKKMIEKADQLLFVVDINDDDRSELQRLPDNIGITTVYNKIDTQHHAAQLIENAEGDHQAEIYLSAKTGDGVDILKSHLKKCMGYQQNNEGQFIARRRHLDAINNAEQYLRYAHVNLHELKAGELLAEELRMAQEELSSITGEFSSDDLLGRIFSDFCIGK